MGENGAGKSTLLKILSGDKRPDSGHIAINGEVKRFSSPIESIGSGISVIYQERQLLPAMTVMENVFLEDLPTKRAVMRVIDKKALQLKTQEIIDTFGIAVRPEDIVGQLSVAFQQMVEIMKAYRRDSDIIAFDEPTAPLTHVEITALFNVIAKLKERGKVIIYVSHRMEEIFKISDSIVVLKDGCFVKSFETAAAIENELINAMVGRDIGDTYAGLRRNDSMGDVVLDVKEMTTADVQDVSFSLRKGEILGFAGLVGAGRTEVVRAVYGAAKILSGTVEVDGETVGFKSPKDALSHGIALCPEDRKEEGLVLSMSIRDNVAMPVLTKLRKGLFHDTAGAEALATEAKDKYSIKTPSVNRAVAELSGGNQQKVILGRSTSGKMTTKILILDEPTKGIDVGTKAEVYQIMCDLARAGIGVIFISSELTEVLNVCDNIIVMHNGHITGRLSRQEATEEIVLRYAMLN
jgi:ABC-type sugar transport system ATPase subunit